MMLAEGEWPKGTRQYVFLGEAVAKVWAALFPRADEGNDAQRETTFSWIADQARDGDIPTFGRNIGGGPFGQLPAHVWNVEPHDRIFEQGMVQKPPTSPWEKRKFVLVFLDRLALDKRLALLRTAEVVIPSEFDGVHLSAYLKLALAVASELGISPTNQLKKQEIIDTIIRLAPTYELDDAKLLGETATGYLAQFIRDPASMLGRAKPKQGSDPLGA